MDTVLAQNDGTSAYTIYIDGTLDGMADFSALNKNLTLTIKALSSTATLNANKKSRVIYATSTSGALNLTLENLTIKGGNTSGSGGGVCLYQNCTFEMNGGTVSANTTSGNGGDMYNTARATFTPAGGTVSGNTPNDVYTVP